LVIFIYILIFYTNDKYGRAPHGPHPTDESSTVDGAQQVGTDGADGWDSMDGALQMGLERHLDLKPPPGTFFLITFFPLSI
jgi:hypothetical protein